MRFSGAQMVKQQTAPPIRAHTHTHKYLQKLIQIAKRNSWMKRAYRRLGPSFPSAPKILLRPLTAENWCFLFMFVWVRVCLSLHLCPIIPKIHTRRIEFVYTFLATRDEIKIRQKRPQKRNAKTNGNFKDEEVGGGVSCDNFPPFPLPFPRKNKGFNNPIGLSFVSVWWRKSNLIEFSINEAWD